MNTFDQLYLQLFEFKWFGWDKPRQMSNWWDAVKSVVYPAGWMPGNATTFFFFWLRMKDTEEGIPPVSRHRHCSYAQALRSSTPLIAADKRPCSTP